MCLNKVNKVSVIIRYSTNRYYTNRMQPWIPHFFAIFSEKSCYKYFNIRLRMTLSARFCKTLFLPDFFSNQLEILKQHSQSSQEGCYDFSKTSIVFFRINPGFSASITILLNGKMQFLLTCYKVIRYRTMLLFKCKRQYLLTCKVSRYCPLACTAVGL